MSPRVSRWAAVGGGEGCGLAPVGEEGCGWALVAAVETAAGVAHEWRVVAAAG